MIDDEYDDDFESEEEEEQDYLFGEDDEEEEEDWEDEEEWDDEDDLGGRDHELKVESLADSLAQIRKDYDEDEEEDPEDSYVFEEEEDQDLCMMCNLEGVKAQDRWKFKMQMDDGTEETSWICRQCHGQFDSIEQFNKFVSNIQFRRLYMKASQLLRMLAMDVPIELISKSVTSLSSVLFWTDEHGGSEKVRRLASEHLRGVAEKYLGDRKE